LTHSSCYRRRIRCLTSSATEGSTSHALRQRSKHPRAAVWPSRRLAGVGDGALDRFADSRRLFWPTCSARWSQLGASPQTCAGAGSWASSSSASALCCIWLRRRWDSPGCPQLVAAEPNPLAGYRSALCGSGSSPGRHVGTSTAAWDSVGISSAVARELGTGAWLGASAAPGSLAAVATRPLGLQSSAWVRWVVVDVKALDAQGVAVDLPAP
jgi:hypothetical protein